MARTINSEGGQTAGETTKREGKLVFFLFILLIIAVVGFVWSFSSYRQYKQKVVKLSTPEGQQELVKQEMDVLLAKVGKHIVLPTDEQPTVATIVDPESLTKDQPFYKGVQKGDKVLIYVKAQKAIIYSEAKDLLVNVGPVYLENKAPATPTEAPVSQISLEIRNGSKIVGAGRELETRLAGNTAYNVIKVTNAANEDYSGLTIHNLKGKDVSALATGLGAKVETALPAGEAGTMAEVLIVVGN